MHKSLKAKERDIKEAEIELRRLSKEKSVIEEERKELLKQKAKLELEAEEAEARAKSDKENQKVGRKESLFLYVYIRSLLCVLTKYFPSAAHQRSGKTTHRD